MSTFGERVILFEARNFDELAALAQDEATLYVRLNPGFRRLGEFTAFSLGDAVTPAHGVEVWCMLFEASATWEQFLRQRYEAVALANPSEA
jgi:hypothetical protein